MQTTVAGILGLWLLFSLFNNGQYASLSASIPDHVPVRQRATVAGWVGMPQAVGLVIGVLLVAKVFKGFSSGYSFLAICMVLFILPFVFATADYPTAGLTTMILIYTVCVVLTATIGGRISDRLGKRKMIVTVSGGLMGAAASPAPPPSAACCQPSWSRSAITRPCSPARRERRPSAPPWSSESRVSPKTPFI